MTTSPKRGALALAILLAATAAGASGHAQAPALPPKPTGVGLTAPAARPFRLGALRLVALRDAQHIVDNDGSIFGVDVGAPAVAEVLKAANAPTDKVTLGVDALLIRTPGHLVLIDTGYGAAAGGVLQQSLAQAGASADQVTDVLLTHTHPDHSGGLLTADGHPAFPKAVVHMSAEEWSWMQTQPRTQAIAKAIAAQVQTFTPGAEVLPGVTSVDLSGHTPGHTGYEISSQGRRLLDMGDTAHSVIVSLSHPEWNVGFDADRAQGRARRLATLKRLAADHEMVFSPHFPFPGVGTIVAKGDGYAWRAGVPAP